MVVDAVEEVARNVGEELALPWSTSYQEMIERPDLDGVVIATPTPLHAEMIVAAASAGKHIFSEKPIAFDSVSTEQAIEAARVAGVKLQVGFHRRFDPDWVAAKERMKEGELGDIYLFRTSLRDMKPPSLEYLRTSGGFFVDVTIHDFDTARWMVDEIVELTAVGVAVSDPRIADLGDIDTAVVTLRFANGALGVIDNSRAAGYGYECSTEVVGSRATVRIDNHRRTHVQWLTPGQATVDWVTNFTERYPAAYALELDAFARAIRDDRPVSVRGEDALAALVICQAAMLSLREQRPVQLTHTIHDGAVRYQPASS
jgi:myo-inositol 2-dehydrogenase/D-chiro-inositol 1-dehydrogenase